MSISEWLGQSLFSWNDANGNLFLHVTIAGVVGCVLSGIIVLALVRLARIGIRRYNSKHHLTPELMGFVNRMISVAGVISCLILCMLSLQFNPIVWPTSEEGFSLSYRNVLIAILCIVIARIADKVISARLLEEFDTQTQKDIYNDQYGSKNKSNITGVVRNALFLIVAIILISNSSLSEYTFSFGKVSISITKILIVILVVLIARLLLWILTNLFLYGLYKRERIDLGKQYAYNQLLSYVIYFLAMIFALKWMAIDLTLLLAGAAALLVGIGIALQQVISDFFSGLVILFERSVEVGDFLDFGAYRGTVKKIGLRASIIETIERKDVVIPNSHLVNERVTNWSSTRVVTRFEIGVGVAYGTDTNEVKRLLLEAAKKTDGILDKPMPFIRFADFGASSLDFQLMFFSEQVRTIEDVKSNLRFEINDLFRAHDIVIPFPQREVHMNKS